MTSNRSRLSKIFAPSKEQLHQPQQPLQGPQWNNVTDTTTRGISSGGSGHSGKLNKTKNNHFLEPHPHSTGNSSTIQQPIYPAVGPEPLYPGTNLPIYPPMNHRKSPSLGVPPPAMPPLPSVPSSMDPAFQQSISPAVAPDSGKLNKRNCSPLAKSRRASLGLRHTPGYRATLLAREKVSSNYDVSALENAQRVSRQKY